MILNDLFETATHKPRHVWSKRGKGVEKRVERATDTAIRQRAQLSLRKDDNAGHDR